MDASHLVSAERALSTSPVACGSEGPAAPGAMDNAAVVAD